eukprot:TRINITY_DN2244_c0_g1_i3.p1 TRINITY_DN2244_c0_g1~~TRINITY_DN2244_c0_g1_i3.p1  ORF type:complete len:239 (-),score=27.28 TRINITY_DN2244_c0_g1_i3:338-1054(-)
MLSISSTFLRPSLCSRILCPSSSTPKKLYFHENSVRRRMYASKLWDKETEGGYWMSFFLILIGGTLFAMSFRKMRKDRNRRLTATTVGISDIGGKWSMVDHNGVPVSIASFAGKYCLVYFGFTFCPDICPDELKKLSAALNILEKRVGSNLIQPLFVTLDPWRDSVEQVASYVKQFHPQLIGLTGTPTQCDLIAHKFRVYSTNDREFDDVVGSDDYAVDHSIFIYLLDANGNFGMYQT